MGQHRWKPHTLAPSRFPGAEHQPVTDGWHPLDGPQSGNVGVTVGPLIFGYFILISDFFTTFLLAGAIEVISLVVVILIIKVVFKEPLRTEQHELMTQPALAN